jgi:hypothetical protein
VANEKRLIYAERLKRILQNFEGKLLECGKTEGAEAVKTIIKGLKTEPTVDAVEVVRCKDCKHYDKDALWCNINSPMFSEEHYNWYKDDFCSIGERRTDG